MSDDLELVCLLPAGRLTYVTYRNHRGETALRMIAPLGIYHGSTEHHPRPQYLLQVLDLDRREHRMFALRDIVAWQCEWSSVCEPCMAGLDPAVVRLIEMHGRVVRLRAALERIACRGEPGKVKSIYIASKARHGPRWQGLRASGAPIISTWIDESGEGDTSDWVDLWKRCISEAMLADVLVLYREPGDVLKGGLVEAGAAIAAGRPVYAVGCEEYSFLAHPLVITCGTLEDALERIACRDQGEVGPHLEEPRSAAIAREALGT